MVRASFDQIENWETAASALQKAGWKRMELFSPAPCSQLDRLLPPSPVRFFTFAGALIGFIGGWALTLGTSLAWPLITGGKAIISVPPFLVIVFELTVLLASLANLLGLLLLGRLPFSGRRGYQPAFSQDRFGIVVDGLSPQQAQALAADFYKWGAVEAECVE